MGAYNIASPYFVEHPLTTQKLHFQKFLRARACGSLGPNGPKGKIQRSQQASDERMEAGHVPETASRIVCSHAHHHCCGAADRLPKPPYRLPTAWFEGHKSVTKEGT